MPATRWTRVLAISRHPGSLCVSSSSRGTPETLTGTVIPPDHHARQQTAIQPELSVRVNLPSGYDRLRSGGQVSRSIRRASAWTCGAYVGRARFSSPCTRSRASVLYRMSSGPLASAFTRCKNTPGSSRFCS